MALDEARNNSVESKVCSVIERQVATYTIVFSIVKEHGTGYTVTYMDIL